MHRGFLSALLSVSFFFSSCSKTVEPVSKVAVEVPEWIYDPFVGVSRITASGYHNDQRKFALRRAIADLLMTKGRATGSSVLSMQRDISITNKDEALRKHFKESSLMNVTYKELEYDIRVTHIWRDPYTKELYVKIEEIK